MNKKELNEILKNPFNRQDWQLVLEEFFGAKYFRQQPLKIALPNYEKAESAFELGSFNTIDDRLIGLYHVKVKPGVRLEKNKVGLRQLLRSIYKHDVDGALVVFEQDLKWRLSFISEIRTINSKGEPEELLTEPKRFSYLLGLHESVRTATDRIYILRSFQVSLNDIYDSFSVEKLNEEFFNQYLSQYKKFCTYLIANTEFLAPYPSNYTVENKNQEKISRDFVKRLLGRIVFLHFLQKKGWLGVKSHMENWDGGDRDFLFNLFLNSPHQENFLSKTLRSLFFETLNQKRVNDIAPREVGENVKIPYLNGGLFDKDELDFSKIDFPVDYFEDLLKFFRNYNFTIYENDPYDREVGIDPEMLGHIFENLLEENREKGAYYTPKVIVHYMCQESVINYLGNCFPEINKNEFSQLIQQKIISKAILDLQLVHPILEKLKSIKICDLAVGSGAFPMGMLQVIFDCRRLLYGSLNDDTDFNQTEIKKQIIQENIFGVDIDNGAVEIARLRFWLALVVEEKNPQPLPNLDYKILQGNSLLESYNNIDLSLITKNDLMIIEPEEDIFGEISLDQLKTTFTRRNSVSEINSLIHSFFSLSDIGKKIQIKDAINNLVMEHISWNIELKLNQKIRLIAELTSHSGRNMKQEKLLKDLLDEKSKLTYSLQNIEKIANKPEKPFFLWSIFFADVLAGGGFDIVISNPPFLKEMDNAERFKAVNESDFGSKWHEGKMDYWYYFLHKAIDIIKHDGVITFITSRYWLNSKGASKLIKRISTELSFINLVDIGKLKVFDNVCGHHMIAIYSKKKRDEFTYTKISNDINSILSPIISPNLQMETLSNKEVFSSKKEIILQKDVFKSKDDTIKELYDISQGVIEAVDRVVSDKKNKIRNEIGRLDEGVFVLLESEILSMDLNQHEISLLKPYVYPTDVKRYYTDLSTKKFLIYANKDSRLSIEKDPNFKNIKKHLQKHEQHITSSNGPFGLHRPRESRYFDSPKIIFKSMFSEPECSYDDQRIYFGLSFSSIIEKNGQHGLKYLLAILNSKLAKFWYYSYGKLRGSGVDIGVGKLNQFPIKFSDFTSKVESLVDSIIYLSNPIMPQLITHTSNIQISTKLEEVLNFLIIEIYFREDMNNYDLCISNFLEIDEVSSSTCEKNILRLYMSLQESENPIRNRILLSDISKPKIFTDIFSI